MFAKPVQILTQSGISKALLRGRLPTMSGPDGFAADGLIKPVVLPAQLRMRIPLGCLEFEQVFHGLDTVDEGAILHGACEGTCS